MASQISDRNLDYSKVVLGQLGRNPEGKTGSIPHGLYGWIPNGLKILTYKVKSGSTRRQGRILL